MMMMMMTMMMMMMMMKKKKKKIDRTMENLKCALSFSLFELQVA
jgi:hypothetical protein